MAPQLIKRVYKCFFVSSVTKDCLVLSQYDLHLDTFLLVTPRVMCNYKSAIIQCKSTYLRWRVVLS